MVDCDIMPFSAHGITILTVNYHCAALTGRLIDSCLRAGGRDLSVVVIDNSPNDPELEKLKQANPAVTIIQSRKNIGYGAACNLGLEYIESEDRNAVVWILNPDARLLPDSITAVKQILSANPLIPILGTAICDFDGQAWFQEGSFNHWLGSFPDRSHHRSEAHDGAAFKATTWVSGCSMILNLPALSRAPQFDVRLFLYYEDVDLCLRLGYQGHQVYVTKSTLAEHAISQTMADQPTLKFRHATFSKLYVLHRHASIIAVILNLTYFALWPSISLLGWPVIKGRWLGIGDYLKWFNYQILPER